MPSIYSDDKIGIFDVRVIATKFDSNKTLEITSIVGSISITNALNHQTYSGSITIVDNTNLLNNDNFSFVGEEFIDITIKKPNTDDEFRYKFVAATVVNETKSETADSAVFIVTLLSSDSFTNAGIFKSTGYKGKGSEIVRDILKQELKTEVEITDDNFEDPDGELSYAFTRIKPLEKVSILTDQSYKNRSSLTSIFMFYENKKGYNFETFERIMERSIANNSPITFTHTPLAYFDREETINSITTYESKGTYDNFKRLYYGMYNTELLNFDFITKELRSESFNLLENINSTLHLNRPDPGASDAFRQAANNLGAFTYYTPFDSRRDDNTSKAILYSSAFSILLRENTLLIKTFGNLNLDVGDVINVEILDNLPTSDTEKHLDARYSGKYIIFAMTRSLGVSAGGMQMFNNMLIVNDGAFRQANFYNQLYRDSNPVITIPALNQNNLQPGSVNNDSPTIIPQANSSNQVP